MMEMMVVELLNRVIIVYMMHDVNPVYLHQQPYVCFICEIIRQISFSLYLACTLSPQHTLSVLCSLYNPRNKTSMPVNLTGGCSCTALTYRVSLDSLDDARVTLCHCSSCKVRILQFQSV